MAPTNWRAPMFDAATQRCITTVFAACALRLRFCRLQCASNPGEFIWIPYCADMNVAPRTESGMRTTWSIALFGE